MAFIPALNVAEIDINQRLHGEQVQNTLYAVNFSGWTPANLEVLASEIITWVGTELYPNLSSQLSLFNVLVRDLTVEDGPQFTGTPSTPVIGGAIGDALPGNCALCVSFRTGLTGRTRRGRNYVAGLREADAAGNLITEGVANAIVAAYSALNAAMGTAGGAHVVLSRYSNKLPRANGLPTLVNAYVSDNRVDSQRRRLQGRGA